jgi:hypothetical protein
VRAGLGLLARAMLGQAALGRAERQLAELGRRRLAHGRQQRLGVLARAE